MSATTLQPARPFIERGTTEFRRTNLAFLCAGFSTFALLYCVQPLLPGFSAAFHVSPATSSLALSLPTAVMAFAMLLASAVSEALGRKPLMVASVFGSALLTLLAGFAPGWEGFLALRALLGLTLCGLPAIAMAYIAEEVHPRSSGYAMGLYISGSAFGGLVGRVVAGLLLDHYGWRVAMGGIGALGLVSALVFWRCLPPSRQFRPRPLLWGQLAANFATHLRDGGMRWLYLLGFLLMGSFVTLYNYIGYRLLAAPFSLPHSLVAAVFSVYLVGIGSSTFVGGLADRFGRPRVLWVTVLVMLLGVALTLSEQLALVVAGLVAVTFGFFGSHALTSSWVGRRAGTTKAQASSLYLFCYYMGAAILGGAGGLAWSAWGWEGVVALLGGALSLALLAALRLAAGLPPPR
ncbi:MFS transporter [Pseudoroseomonas cervicalis]|uniref:MFS transporter n=1 Tax=Teichococcus cervicalis TaxID=204525 RepID=UPI0022F16432|nr:MFS transporter [Pseudoroseomonas cervicalis]WBV41969.1 MFS transporter [Pseudoroseomonas cervicalis]